MYGEPADQPVSGVRNPEFGSRLAPDSTSTFTTFKGMSRKLCARGLLITRARDVWPASSDAVCPLRRDLRRFHSGDPASASILT
jgi:hypothetical protein